MTHDAFVYTVYSPCFCIDAKTNIPVWGYPKDGEPPINIVHLENQRVYFDESIRIDLHGLVTAVIMFIRERTPEATHLYMYNINVEHRYVEYTFINKEKKLRLARSNMHNKNTPFVESEWLTVDGK
ncbi:hypothetical protein HPMBJEAJ_00184 [Aeromonas phage avDM6]|nr:hypothetical protein HPMBJEAJ_00184 [Aeromonas phage avDM6]